MLAGRGPSSPRRHLYLPQCGLHGACLRRREIRQLLAATVHRHGHPQPHRPFGRASGQARDVVLCTVRAVQVERGHVGREARGLWRQCHRHNCRVCAQSEEHHCWPSGGDTPRSRARIWTDRGKYFPGGTLPGTVVLLASRTGFCAVQVAHQEPLDVRFGHASGRLHHGCTGTAGGAGNLEAHEREKLAMAQTRDVVILGAGHNGLVTAFYLAKAGLKPLILERRPTIGGCAITEEFHPGFRCSRLAHSAGPMRSDIVRDMNLVKHGLKTYIPEVRVLSLSGDGKPLVLYSDAGKSQQEIARFSQKDATNYVEFQEPLAHIGEVAHLLMTMTPPDLEDPAAGNLWELIKAGRKVRGLGEKDLYRMMRWGPMAVADLVAEWFDTELLRGTIAAQGIFGTFLGPWSAGSSATLLLRCASNGNPAGSGSYIVGGLGALTAAMATAAKEAGAEIRTSCEVASIKVKDGSAAGVVLANGDEIDAHTVVSNCDPKRTLLGLVDPQYLKPSFLQKLQHYRVNGTVAKVNRALGGLPKFKGANGNAAVLSGRIQVSPDIDYLEHAFDASKRSEEHTSELQSRQYLVC